MGKREFCGCCSLRGGGICTGLLASVYNGLLFYWFLKALGKVHSSDELFLVLTILIEVLMFLAAIHVAVSVTLIYATVKCKPDLVMLWIVTYISSCCIVSDLFTIGLAFLMDKVLLYIVCFNFLFIFNIIMTLRLYKEMVEKSRKETI